MPTSADPRSTTGVSADTLAAILRLPDLAVLGLSPDGIIQYCNLAASRVTRWLEADLIGRPFDELLPVSVHGMWRKMAAKLRRGRSVPAAEFSLIAPDGTSLMVSVSAIAVPGEGRAVSGIALVLRDVSAQARLIRQARQDSAQWQAIVQSAIDGIIAINDAGVIEAFNPAAERLFGYAAHEVIGRNVSILMPQPYRDAHDGYIKRYLETGHAKIIGIGREVTALRKDGSEFPADLSVAEIRIDERSAFVGVLRDISQRKEAERQLTELNRQLKDKVEELGEALAQLSATQEQLVESEKMASLGMLVAGVAHEINTPLGVCVTAASHFTGLVEDLQRSLHDGRLTKTMLLEGLEEARDTASLIQRNVDRAARLVMSFKQTAVDRSRKEVRRFDLGSCLQDILVSSKPLWRGQKIQVHLECPENLSLSSDPGALSQVMVNLIHNAVTHAFPDGREGDIWIEVRDLDPRVQISVRDNGRGIAPENLSRLFDPFFTTARGSGGTGLGLHITYNLVTQALGGSIDVASAPEHGATFRLSIPTLDGTAGPADDEPTIHRPAGMGADSQTG